MLTPFGGFVTALCYVRPGHYFFKDFSKEAACMAGFGEQEGLRGVTNHMQGLLAVLRSPGARQLLSPDATHRDCASEFTNQVCVGDP